MVQLPLAVVLSVIGTLAGVIVFLFYRLEKARQDAIDLQAKLASERADRLTFVEQKLMLTERREAEAIQREGEKDTMLAGFLDLAKAQTTGGIRAVGGAGRRPMPSNPRGGGE